MAMSTSAATRAALLEKLRQKRLRGEKNKYEANPDEEEIAEEADNSATEDEETEEKVEQPKPKRSKVATVPVKKLSDFVGFSVNAELNESNADKQLAVKKEEPILKKEPDCGQDSKPFKFYCLDAYEDAIKKPGDIFLFGKTLGDKPNEYVSCCVRVRGVKRRVFILPRQLKVDTKTGQELNHLVTADDVEEELKRLHVKHFSLNKTPKEMMYCLAIADVPKSGGYLELRYPFKELPLPLDISGSTFSHAFGTTSSGLEIFLLENRLRLPCWIELHNAVANNVPISYCNIEMNLENPDQTMLKTFDDCAPPLRLLSLSIKTMPNLENGHKEIIAIGMCFHDSYSLEKAKQDESRWRSACIVKKGPEQAHLFDFKQKLAKEKSLEVHVHENERALLNLLLVKIQQHNPDLVVGHDLWDFELQTFIGRIADRNLPQPHRLGRLRRGTTMHRAVTKFDVYDALAGRLVCDLKVMAMEFILRSKSFDLTELAKQVLGENRVDIGEEAVAGVYSSSESLINFIKMAVFDAGLCCRLMARLGCLALTSEITRIVGGVWSKTLAGGRSERTEFLLLHAFEAANYIAPEKIKAKKAVAKIKVDDDDDHANFSNRKKNSYVGGLVLDPKKGLYENYVLLLDFNSLYPSIIMEYNVCFSTIELRKIHDDVVPELPESGQQQGILPTVVRNLVERRREVKKLMKVDVDRYQELNIRQQALKITANSMYGCLGFSSSRFYAKSLAALITHQGREILMDTKNLVEKMYVDVVYGDTDSVMINTNSDKLEDALTLGRKITIEVNKKYRQLELDIDGVYKKLLLYKKKKYAGLMVDLASTSQGVVKVTREMKGLEIVRRDCPPIAVEAGSLILDRLLDEFETNAILENIFRGLSELAENMRNGNIPLEKYEILKQLNKAPSEYGEKKLPHVSVALRLNANGRHFKQGDVVPYIICENGTTEAATQRAYHRSEMEADNSLKIDVAYYLSQQVHPIVTRLLEPVKGANAMKVAECLGLDPAAYRRHIPIANKESFDDFSGCIPFTFKCPGCNTENEVASVFLTKENENVPSLLICTNPDCSEVPWQNRIMLANHLQKLIRELIEKHYENWLVCDDVVCGVRCRKMVVDLGRRGKAYCFNCHQFSMDQEYSAHQLYSQLTYFQHIFDWTAAESKLPKKPRGFGFDTNLRSAYDDLKKVVDGFVSRNAYGYIDLGKLFKSFV